MAQLRGIGLDELAMATMRNAVAALPKLGALLPQLAAGLLEVIRSSS